MCKYLSWDDCENLYWCRRLNKGIPVPNLVCNRCELTWIKEPNQCIVCGHEVRLTNRHQWVGLGDKIVCRGCYERYEMIDSLVKLHRVDD